jgi:pyruvate dehydrogenase E1 component alpha subunit
MMTKSVDGSDVEAVYHAVSDAIERARNGEGPSVIESRVARLVPHFEGDKETYRDTEEFERLKEEKNPIENYRERVLDAGILTEDEIEAMVERIEREVDEAVEFARDSPEPSPEAAYENVYRTPLYGQGDRQ